MDIAFALNNNPTNFALVSNGKVICFILNRRCALFAAHFTQRISSDVITSNFNKNMLNF